MITTPKDYFEEIGRFEPVTGIFLTYTLDIEVVEKLMEACPGNIIVLHDYRNGISLSDRYEDDRRNKLSDHSHHKVVCYPVVFPWKNEHNCFHPKLSLLRNNEGVMMMIGSANLSKDAFIREKELMAASRMQPGEGIFLDALGYVASLVDYVVGDRKLLKDALDRFRVHPYERKDASVNLFFNTHDSLFDRLVEWLPQETFESVHVISPFLSPRDQAGLRQFKEAFKANQYRFHLRRSAVVAQNIGSVFPEAQVVSLPGQQTFHYKAYVFRSRTSDYLAIGSANFTTQGFFRSANKQGNMESMLLINQPRSEEVTNFLEKKWSKPVIVSSLEVDDEVFRDVDESGHVEEPYAFATRLEKGVSVTLYLPVDYRPQDIRLQPRALSKWEPVKHAPGFYQAMLPMCQSVQIECVRPVWKNKIVVLDTEQFTALYTYHGDGLFDESDKTYSVRRKEMEHALMKIGRSVNVGGALVSQRPVLEKYYRNVWENLQKLSKKKYFSMWHEQELQRTLQSESGATGIYLTLKYHTFFSAHPEGATMARICRDRLEELSALEEFSGIDISRLMSNPEKLR